jgi:hypothetical protein
MATVPPTCPDLSVIVVTHDGRELALRTLRSARGHAGPVDVQWLVVDSGSTDGTPDALEDAWPGLEVTRCPNIGFAAANNVALEHARGRHVLLLNPDVEITRGTLADLVAALDRRPEVGAASVVQTAPDGTPQHSMRRFPTPARQLAEAFLASRWPIRHTLQEAEVAAAAYAKEHSADWLVGAFLAVRREALDQVGGLDERFFLYSEEKDWCLRIRQAGWDVRHLPVMTVVHHTGGYARPELRAQLTYSNLLFARKHFSPRRRAAYRVALGAKHLLRLAAIAPAAAVRPPLRSRTRGDIYALRLIAGAAAPPFRPGDTSRAIR